MLRKRPFERSILRFLHIRPVWKILEGTRASFVLLECYDRVAQLVAVARVQRFADGITLEKLVPPVSCSDIALSKKSPS